MQGSIIDLKRIVHVSPDTVNMRFLSLEFSGNIDTYFEFTNEKGKLEKIKYSSFVESVPYWVGGSNKLTKAKFYSLYAVPFWKKKGDGNKKSDFEFYKYMFFVECSTIDEK